MRQRRLGRTGLAVSEIGFGCGPTADLMVRGDADLRRRTVARALDLGINYFDTAPGYGDFASESNLGQTLAELGASPIVATKVALAAEDLNDIAGAVVRSVHGSLARLRLAQIPLIQLHNRVGPAGAAKADLGRAALLSVADVLGPGGVVEAFEQLRRDGLVRFFGCSAFGGDMGAARQVINGAKFDAIIASYSVANPSAWQKASRPGLNDYAGIGRTAAAAGMGAIGLRALEGGALFADPDAPAINGRPWAVDQKAAAARAQAQRRALGQNERDFAYTAIRFALSNPEIATVLIGLSNVDQVDAAAAASAAGPLTSETLARLAAA